MKNEFGNTNSKDIWNNHLLCAQVLRSYSGVPLLAHVQPEDITDETEKLRPFLGVEFEGDAVKKVRITQPAGWTVSVQPVSELPVYVVALLEHKSSVDYDVCFQLLKYMTGIWALYRNEQNRQTPGASGRKGFRYPLIIPIVYYEGKENWTADMHWRDRVENYELFGEYVPDFTYHVINLHKYSAEELLSREEELSLVMLFNRVQTAEDLDFQKFPKEQRETARRILQKAPEAVLRLLTEMVYHFGLKLHVPEKDLQRYVKNVEDRNMGELWANMDEINIQEAWDNLAKARNDVAEAEKDAARARKDAAEAQEHLTKIQLELAAAQESLEERERSLEETERSLEETERSLEETERSLEERERSLEERDQLIAVLQEEIFRLKSQSPT